jgi:D-alanyl-D-alanine carboxypeptidase
MSKNPGDRGPHSKRGFSPEEAEESLARSVAKLRKRHDEFADTGMTLSAPSVDFHAAFGADREPEKSVFHVASVGKLFTTALIGMLLDDGRLGREAPIVKLLPAALLNGLFEIDGSDYRDRVTVAHLLSHTSGVADYWEDPIYVDGRKAKESAAYLAQQEPDRSWTPKELLAWTGERQRPVARPGERFHYSDTGFVLLGLIAEEIEGAPFHALLSKRMFAPLEMVHASMPGRSRPADPATPEMRPLWIEGANLAGKASLTVDWAGGGVTTTSEELIRFARAFHDGTLLSGETLAWLREFNWKFRRGIAYGHGVMEMRFGEFVPLLRSLPRMSGHMGVTGVQLFANPKDRTVISISTGTTRGISRSVRLLIAAAGAVQKLKR